MFSWFARSRKRNERSARPRLESLEQRIVLDNTYHSLAGGNFSQNWSDASLISTNDSWTGVPSIEGYRGDSLASVTLTNPQTVLAPGIAAGDSPAGVLDVNANQTNPNTFTTGGVAEFTGANVGNDNVVALQGSGTADAPFLLLYLDTTGRHSINVSYKLRDIDGSTDNTLQQVALQYRVGDTGNFIDVPEGYIRDASRGPSDATRTDSVSVTLPPEVNNQSKVQVRIITTDAPSSDEWVGVDDISVTSSAIDTAGTFDFQVKDFRISETGTTATVRVVRSGGTGSASVDYAVTSGTATAGVDFTATSGTLNFGASDTFQEFTVTIADDVLLEKNETINLTLSNASSGAGLGAFSTATITMLENERATVVVNEVSVNPDGTDNPFEYLEIKGTPGASLANILLVGINGDSTFAGTVNNAFDLSNQVLGSNGLLVVKSASGGHTIPGATTVVTDRSFDELPTLGNSTVTFALIFSTKTIVPGTSIDLDTGNDGTLDLSSILGSDAVLLDAVGWSDGGSGDLVYGSVSLTQTSGIPDAATRFRHDNSTTTGAWYNGDLQVNGTPDPSDVDYDSTNVSSNFPTGGAAAEGKLTPGAHNTPNGTTTVAGNNAPVGVNDSYNTTEDSSGIIISAALGVLSNDTDADDMSSTNKEILGATLFSGPSGGSLTFAADGSFRYVPFANFFGPDTFTYTVTDGIGTSSTTTVTINVAAVADTPSVDTPTTTNEDTQTGLIKITRNAADSIEVTNYKITNIQNGRLFQSDGSTEILAGAFITDAEGAAGLKFTPDADENDATPSTFSFDIQASTSNTDAGLGGNVITAVINVTPVNDEPTFTLAATNIDRDEDSGMFSQSNFLTALSVSGGTDESSTQTITLVDVSNDFNGLFSSQPTIDGAGNLTFTLAPNAFGTATVTVTVTDSGSGSAPNDNVSVQQFTITVKGLADTPSVDTPTTTSEDTQTGLIKITRNAADSIEVTNYKITNIQNGRLFQSDGSTEILAGAFITDAEGAAGLKFTPDANENDGTPSTFSFDIQASTSNTDAGLGGNVITAVINVTPVNDNPTAVNDTFTVQQNSGATVFDVLGNDSFAPDAGETLTVTTVSAGTAGGTITNNGTNISYKPATGFSGTETFTYDINDGNGGTDTATVTVTVTPINVAPPPPPASQVGLKLVAFGADAGAPARVRVVDAATRAPRLDFIAFEGYSGGVTVAVGDVNGDGNEDILVGTAALNSHVKVFDGVTGALVRSFIAFDGFTGGVSVAAGDVNGDGAADIIVGTMTLSTHVKVFDGRSGAVIASFIAYEGFGGGVRVAAGDVNGDGRADIVTVAGPGGNGHIKVFSVADQSLLQSLLAYVGFSGEVSIAAGDYNGDGRADISTSALGATGPHARVRDGATGADLASFFVTMGTGANNGNLIKSGNAITSARIAAGDVNGDGRAELIFASGPNTTTTALFVDAVSLATIDQIFAFDPTFTRGAFVGA